jgi:hypothetical protein
MKIEYNFPGVEYVPIEQLKERNEACGMCWFSGGNTSFFGSRYPLGGYRVNNKIYFVTSERDGYVWNSKRRYTIRMMNWNSGDTETVGDYGEFSSWSGANGAMNRLVKGLVSGN